MFKKEFGRPLFFFLRRSLDFWNVRRVFVIRGDPLKHT